MRKVTREDAIRLFDRATDKDDPFWEVLLMDFIEDTDDEDTPLPSILDVFAALGVSESEYEQAIGA